MSVKPKIKKVLLLTPPADTFKDTIDINPVPPLGLAYIAAVLERNGIEVKIVDCLGEGWENRIDIGDNVIRIGLSFEEVEQIIRDYTPDMVGVSNLFSKQSGNAHKIYKIAKKANPDIVTVAGGAHPTVMPRTVLEDVFVDYVVIGEGEYTLVDIIKVIEGQKNISELDGVGYKENGEIKIIPKTKFIENLDELPFPARHLLNMEKYLGLKASHGSRKKNRFTPIITSRGCPAKCTFCSANQVWGKKYRYRSPENVIAEMKYLKEKYDIEELMFEDDNVTLNIPRAHKLFDLMIEEKLDFAWDTPNGVAAYSLNGDLIDKMKESGCYKVNLAVETGNQYVMDHIIKKPLKLEKVKPLVEHCRKVKMDVGMFLVVGMPGETEEQIWDSFRFAVNVGIFTPHISIATPYPGSELYDICVEKRYISEKFSLNDLYIRSFSISTENWDADKLKSILREGKKFLAIAFLKKHPIIFLKQYKNILIHPWYAFKRIWFYLKKN